MRRFVFTLLAAVAMLAGLPPARAQGGEVVFGIYPVHSPTRIVELFTPLRDHIAAALGRPVTIVSAPDFATFIERTRKGDYDVAFTAPHMGRLAEKRDGYLPVAQSGYRITAIVVVRKESTVRSVDDLRGRTVAVGSRDSMTFQIMDQVLRQKKMALGREVPFIESATFSNVMQAVIHKEVEAGVTGLGVWQSAPEEQRRQLDMIYRAEPAPGFFVIAHPRLGDAARHKLQAALTSFKDTPEGAEYFKRTAQVDFRPMDAATMKQVDPYVAVLTQPR